MSLLIGIKILLEVHLPSTSKALVGDLAASTGLETKHNSDLISHRHAMNFLAQKGIVTADPQTHRELLKTIWFNMYSRGGGKIGSSGFEHVFLSEVKNGTVMGLHNWIYLSEAEKSGDLDYKGWTKKIDLGNVRIIF